MNTSPWQSHDSAQRREDVVRQSAALVAVHRYRCHVWGRRQQPSSTDCSCERVTPDHDREGVPCGVHQGRRNLSRCCLTAGEERCRFDEISRPSDQAAKRTQRCKDFAEQADSSIRTSTMLYSQSSPRLRVVRHPMVMEGEDLSELADVDNERGLRF